MRPAHGHWATKKELAVVLGLSESGFEKAVRRAIWFDLGSLALRDNGRLWYRCPETIEAWARHRYELTSRQAGRRNGTSSSYDHNEEPSFRLARVRADREEDRYRRECGELVVRADMHAALMPGFSVLRNAIIVLERNYGDEAGEIIRDAIDAAERGALEYFGQDEMPRSSAPKARRRERSESRKKKERKRSTASPIGRPAGDSVIDSRRAVTSRRHGPNSSN